MGIAGHSSDSDDLMYPYIAILNNSEVFNALPVERDVNTVFTLYTLSSASTETQLESAAPPVQPERVRKRAPGKSW